MIHVILAMNDTGKNASPLLNYTQGNDREWLKKSGGPCPKGTLPKAEDCDEYPYASSLQGGVQNREHVYAAGVNSKINQLAGRKLWHELLRPCGVAQIPNSKTYNPWPVFDGMSLFAVVPVPGMALTVGRCANGRTQSGGN